MPKDISLLMCLNCHNYAAGQHLSHRDDCWAHVVVEVITQQVGVHCLHCGLIHDTEPGTCSCGFVAFDPLYKQPTLSHMEAVIHLLIDALAKSQSGPELPEMPSQQPPEAGGSDDDERV